MTNYLKNKTIKKRLEIYSAFTEIPLDDIISGINLIKYIKKYEIKLGCDCGCGGDSIDIDKYFIGITATFDIFTKRK
jgi:hypothetical protein